MQAFKKFLIGGMIALGVLPLATGCSASYWRQLTQTSQPEATVTQRGKLTWTGKTVDSAVVYTVERTPPVVEIKLMPNSANLNLEVMQIQIVSPIDGAGFEQINDLQVNFFQQIPNDKPLSLELGQILTGELATATNPGGTAPLTDTTLLAQATFVGRGALGESIRWSVTIPIDIEVIEP